MKRSRRSRQSETEGAPEGAGMMRWLLTYSDLITLLMAFFVILYAISRVNTAKYAELSRALKIAFNGRPAVVKLSNQPPTNLIPPVKTVQSMRQLMRQIQAMVAQAHVQNEVKVSTDYSGVVISLMQNLLFRTGSARIRRQGLAVLLSLAGVLRSLPNQIEVQGFTDNVPIHTARYPSNWELSSARANHVLEYLDRVGKVPPTHLSSQGFGQYHPFVPNTTPANRYQNRRVQVVILRQGVTQY